MATVISPKLYARAYAATGTDECRYYLCGVRVESHPDGGALLIATNGKLLVLIRDPDGVCTEPVTITVDPRNLRPAYRKDTRFAITPPHRLIVNGARAGLVVAGATHWTKPDPASTGRSSSFVPFTVNEVAADCAEQFETLGNRLIWFDHRRGALPAADFYPDWKKVIPASRMVSSDETPISIMPANLSVIDRALGPGAVTIRRAEGRDDTYFVWADTRKVDGCAILMSARNDGHGMVGWYDKVKGGA